MAMAVTSGGLRRMRVVRSMSSAATRWVVSRDLGAPIFTLRMGMMVFLSGCRNKCLSMVSYATICFEQKRRVLRALGVKRFITSQKARHPGEGRDDEAKTGSVKDCSNG